MSKLIIRITFNATTFKDLELDVREGDQLMIDTLITKEDLEESNIEIRGLSSNEQRTNIEFFIY